MLTCSLVTLALATIAPQNAPVDEPTPRPHVVVVLADDMGWTDLSTGRPCLGHASTFYRTPHLAALADAGMSFTNAYSNGPNCAPTRAALMSGQHAARTGVYTVGSSNRGKAEFRKLAGAKNRPRLDPDVVTLAETLRAAGYATGHFGKWHLGDDPTHGPTAQGFDVNVAGTKAGSVSGGSRGHFARKDGSFALPGLEANGRDRQFMAERLTDEALAWMQHTVANDATRPLFCYLTHFSVHTPIQAPSAAIDAFAETTPQDDGCRHRNATYAGMLKDLDDQLGRVVDWLEQTADPRRPGHALIENTVVVFTSDNGGLGGYRDAGVAGGQEITHQHPLRSGKGALFEGGVRVPWIVRFDGRVAAGTTTATPVQTLDLYPTLATLARAELPTGQPLDGVDVSPVLDGRADRVDRDALYWHFPAYLQASGKRGTWRTTPRSVVRHGHWKLHYVWESRRFELYDLATDIGERHDRAADEPDRVAELATALRAWLEATAAARPSDPTTGAVEPWPTPPTAEAGRGR